MSAEREARLRLLLRKAERSRELEPFIQRLMDATHLPHDSFRFLSLEETDGYKQILDTRYVQELRTADKLMLVWDEPDEMRHVLSDMAAAADETELMVYFQDSDVLGALVMPARSFLSQAFNILHAAGDCLHAAPRDAASGIMLDLYEEGPAGLRYETLGWGHYLSILEQSVAKLYPNKLVASASRVST